MFTALLLTAKSILNGALRLFLEHWRVLIPLLIVAYCLYAFNAMYKAKNEAINELSAFKQAIAVKVREQEIEQAIKLSIAQQAVEKSQLDHSKQIEAIKNDYAKRYQVNVNTIASLRNSLREKVRSDTFAIPEIDPNTERTADEWRNSYSAIDRQYKNLVDACSITTIDYNLLRDWADIACNQIGCE
ncbi:MAG: hypothetical protein V4570_09810 [Pseudomonadota bacterium]